jgi:wyosine [tRNA(Phe)-imidazoG37] synthetase (radical SAM superfamily)
LYVPTEKVLEEMAELPDVAIDYLTFSGIGEPTLAQNLGEVVSAVRRIRGEPIAVLTNASLISREDVREDLFSADYVIAKLDACSKASFEAVNRPAPGIAWQDVLEGLKRFRADFGGEMALQIMFVHSNKDSAREIAWIAREINPDEVQINTPLRPCREVPLSREIMGGIKGFFRGMNCVSVYDAEKVSVEPISKEHTMLRRGKKKDHDS